MRVITRARALSRILFDHRCELRYQSEAPGMQEQQLLQLGAAEDELLALLDSISESQASAIRERELRGMLFELMPIALLVVDRDGFVCEANGAAEGLVGPALTGRHLSETLLPDRDSRLRVVEDSRKDSVEMRVLSPHGEFFLVRITCHPLPDGSERRMLVIHPLEPGETRATSSSDPSRYKLRWARILVVEDDTDFRELLTKVLSETGARVFGAANGADGLKMVDACAPDVIVSDIVTPVMDGYAFLRAVRARQLDVPAIALTGLATELDSKRALEAGFDLHLQKPIDPAVLIQHVRDLQAGRSSRINVGGAAAMNPMCASEYP